MLATTEQANGSALAALLAWRAHVRRVLKAYEVRTLYTIPQTYLCSYKYDEQYEYEYGHSGSPDRVIRRNEVFSGSDTYGEITIEVTRQ